jgi:ABC-2 type transport system ATP-binding protein
MPAIATSGLSKDYGAGRGLFDLDLSVDEGEVFGYLGPNGAGKSTTIRVLMDLARASRGHAAVFGLDSHADSVAVKRRTGYLPGELPDFAGLRGSEVVAYIAGLRGGVDRSRVRRICERFDLDLGQRYREYSRGTKQKLAIVLACMHAPDLLVLDEPTSGLDPLNQQEFYDLLREEAARGTTVFLSSHILSEVQHVCDRVGIIREGRLVAVDRLEDLHHLRVHRVEIEFDGGGPPLARIAAAPGVRNATLDDSGHVHCDVEGSFEALMRAISGATVVNLTSTEPTLEELSLTYYRGDGGGPALPLAAS